MKGIILAAGYATRLYPLTLNKAKPLLPVHGRPIIDYLVDEMNTLDDLNQIIVVSNHKFAGQFAEWAAARNAAAKTGEPEIVVFDDGTMSEDDRLGAIGDIQFCIDKAKIDEDLVVIAGDNLFTYKLRDAWQVFKDNGQDMIMASNLPPEEDPTRFAIAVLDDNGLIIDLVEKPEHPKTNIGVYAIYFYRRDTVPLFDQYLKEGNKPDAPGYFPAWLYLRKSVRCYLFEGLCFDIGTPQSYANIESEFPSPSTANK